MKIKPKKMLAGGFLKTIRSVMKVIGKDNAKVIAAKKSISGKGSLDPVKAQINRKSKYF
jgi:histidinol dehydrogenase